MLGACILCTVLFTACGNANPTGAPAAACSTMVPQHGVASQNLSSSPYKIAVAVDSNDASKVKVTVSGSVPFRGIFLQSRQTSDGDALGTWDPPSGTNFRNRDCNGAMNNALTHTSRTDKNLPQDFTWNAPNFGSETNVQIYVTIVREHKIFYAKISAGKVAVQPSSGSDDGNQISFNSFILVTLPVCFFLIQQLILG